MAVVMAGFVDFEITWQADVFSGAPQSSSATNYGTVGINFRARKPNDEAEWLTALEALNCEMPAGQPRIVSIFAADSFYDSGDLGCGDGPLAEIAARLHRLAPGQTLEVRATNPSVAADLPAWCRLTGHPFITRQGDRYLIRRKSDLS
jgi:TusA-related sulfurtransferase